MISNFDGTLYYTNDDTEKFQVHVVMRKKKDETMVSMRVMKMMFQ